MNWQSKKAVLGLLAAVCAVVFVAGAAIAWKNRHKTLCPDGKPPVAQRAGIINQTVYKCHDGRTVTTS
jgi:hypothetical protein